MAPGAGARSELIVAQLRYENVTVRSVTDPEMVTPMLVGIASTVSNKYSEDLSTHVRRGLARRKANGKPHWAIPFGIRVEKTIVRRGGGQRRVIDPANLAHLTRAFEQVAGAVTPGEVGRRLNAAGVRTQRGGLWSRRAISMLIENDDYLGRNGYPRMVSDELWQAANAQLRRQDPAAV